MHHWTAVAPVGTEKAAARTEMYGGERDPQTHFSSVFITQWSIALS